MKNLTFKNVAYLLTFIFFFSLTLRLAAQKRSYRHFEGKSIESIELDKKTMDSIFGNLGVSIEKIPEVSLSSTLDLQFSADSVFGFVSIPKNETRYVVYTLAGKLKSDTLLLFGIDKPFGDSEWFGTNLLHGPIIEFTGKLTGQSQIEGSFFFASFGNVNINRNMDFVYNEIYSPNSVALNHYYAAEDTVIEGDGAEYHLSYDILLPKKYSPISAFDTLTNTLIKMLFPGGSLKKIDDFSLNSFVRKDKIEYYNSTKEMLSDSSEVFLNLEYFNSNNLTLKLNEQGFLSTYYENTFYGGGAHGLSVAKCNVFDIETGKALYLDDIISNKKMLGLLIARKARHDYNIPESASLEEIGMNFDGKEIEPTENFYITKEGIGFVYNEYEIGCYASGRFEFMIPFIDLINYNLLQKSSKILKIAKI